MKKLPKVINNFEGVLIRVQLQNYVLVEFNTYILDVFFISHEFTWFLTIVSIFS